MQKGKDDGRGRSPQATSNAFLLLVQAFESIDELVGIRSLTLLLKYSHDAPRRAEGLQKVGGCLNLERKRSQCQAR